MLLYIPRHAVANLRLGPGLQARLRRELRCLCGAFRRRGGDISRFPQPFHLLRILHAVAAGRPCTNVAFLDSGRSLRHFAVRWHLHAATRATLINLMEAVGVPPRGLTTNVQKLAAILAMLPNIPEAERDACMARAVALAEKRKRNNKRSGGEATCDEAASGRSA